MHKMTVYVPESHLEIVKNALFDAGAGRFKNYDRCCWQTKGQGQFRSLLGSNPHIGQKNEVTFVEEFLIELVCDDDYLEAALTALRQAHPYEEPAYAVWHIN